MILRLFSDTFDPYGKDFTKPTSGTDNLFRMKVDKEGYVCGTVACLSQEEAEAYRKEHAPRRVG